MKRLALFVASLVMTALTLSAATLRDQARAAFDQQNWKDALAAHEEWLVQPQADAAEFFEDVAQALQCRQRLNALSGSDAFVDSLVAAHPESWRAHAAASEYFASVEHHGERVGETFHRGYGGEVDGVPVDSEARDHALAVRHLERALALISGEKATPGERRKFHLRAAGLFAARRGWQLLTLTKTDALPDLSEDEEDDGSRGAPVDEKGNVIYHRVPASWQSAASDGERLRWLLEQAAGVDAIGRAEATAAFAEFMQTQLATRPPEPGGLDLRTLTEDETYAQLATGPRRFTVPAEFNPIRLWQITAEQKASPGIAEQSITALAELHEVRGQRAKAAGYWKRLIDGFGKTDANDDANQRYRQITGNWGRFAPLEAQPAGRRPTFGYEFRNAKAVTFTARPIDVRGLLAATKAAARTGTEPAEEDNADLDSLAAGLVNSPKAAAKWLGKPVSWQVPLEPEPDHQDRRVEVTAPLELAGAYLLEGAVSGGNTSHLVLWLQDTMIVVKSTSGGQLYFVADAVTGQPLPKATLEFFGVRERSGQNTRPETLVRAELTGEDGLFVWKKQKEDDRYEWIVSATHGESRFAVLGARRSYDYGSTGEFARTSAYFVTDRPVYRPGQPVKWKSWAREATYGRAEDSKWARQKFVVRILDPRGEKLAETTHESDSYGGFDGAVTLADDATLGSYRVQVGLPTKKEPRWIGSATFRVEEYKKPEFEVTIEAPKTPVALGEKITATVKATYYFGAPVARAKAKIKVQRHAHHDTWFPAWKWDWLYGRGAWLFGGESFGGTTSRGGLHDRWAPWAHDPEESVIEKEVTLEADGTAKIEFDTAAAKERFGDEDHRYTISVSVTDESRRTIDAEGAVLVAREPFRVHAWTYRGHYDVGSPVEFTFRAQTLDGTGVPAKGRLSLLKITYNEKKEPNEQEVAGFDIKTDDAGDGTQKLSASEAGQYRLKCTLTDAAGRTQEASASMLVRGPGFDGRGFHFDALELVTDRRSYAPGDSARLLVNTAQADSTVLLFIRAENGVVPRPKVLRLRGKSVEEAIRIETKDQPNIHMEALTVAEGEVHSTTREILVPPETRVLTLDVKPSAERFKPRETAKLDLKLTDADGEPFVGSTVVTIYDKALEYISGGSNAPDIRAFFWSWRRHHSASQQTSEPGTQSESSRDTQMMTIGGLSGRASFGGGLRFGRSEISSAAVDSLMNAKSPPMAVAAPMAGAAPLETAAEDAFAAGGGEASPPPVMIRSQFADAALWVAAVETKPDGTATVELPMPDNLTTWKVRSWAMGQGTRVGEAEAEIITSKDLLVRLQAPRFFVEKDEVTLSANVHSYLDTKKEVTVSLELDGGTLEAADSAALTKKITLEPKSEQRVDWTVKAVREGEATVRMKAVADTDSDAMEQKFPVLVHGMLKTDSWSGALRPDQAEAGKINFTVPAERRPDQSELIVRVSPSLALSMLDAIPYLVDYPYGCTEQTLNRFLPAVLARRTLQRTGVNLQELEKKTANLNAQEIGDPATRAAQWKRYERNPVFSEGRMTKIIKANLERLASMQLSDGSWGWFAGAREGDAHLTATVVRGLLVAKEAEVAIPPDMLKEGIDWLAKHQAAAAREIQNAPTKTKPWKEHADDIDALVFTVLAGTSTADGGMGELLFRDKKELSVYSKAMLAVAWHTLGQTEKREALRKNVEQFLVTDAENQTARLKLGNEGSWWHWYGSEYEAQAWYLKLLARVEPKGATASGLVKWLLNNRKNATWWNSTRDTALVLEAMADYLKATGEGEPAMTIRVLVDGAEKKAIPVSKDNLFTLDNTLTLRGDELTSGAHTVEVRREGKGPVYFNAYLTNFTKEDAIPAAGLEVKVERRYWKLTPKPKTQLVEGSRGQALEQQGSAYDRTELKSGDAIASGTLVEVELILESKNDYEYLLIEDPKAAGFEPVDVQSGYDWTGLGAYRELRDQKVAHFVRSLPTGRSTLTYRLRAEVPGNFSALPAKASAMYAPELRGNSAEARLGVTE